MLLPFLLAGPLAPLLPAACLAGLLLPFLFAGLRLAPLLPTGLRLPIALLLAEFATLLFYSVGYPSFAVAQNLEAFLPSLRFSLEP